MDRVGQEGERTVHVAQGIVNLAGNEVERATRGVRATLDVAEGSLRQAGATTFAEDERSCVAFGMPGEAIARERFLREAHAAAAVEHPNVLPVYRAGIEDGHAYLVMRYVAGEDLRTLVRATGSLPVAQALDIVAALGEALDAIHRAGFVHRDVKPANVLRARNGPVKLGDFGIARSQDTTALTEHGSVLGTAAYLAPEQAMGEPATAASDRYALSVVAFELLTGEKPFQAEHFAAQARAQIEDDPPRVSELAEDLSERVDDVIDRGMAKDPDDRWSSAAESSCVAATDSDDVKSWRLVGSPSASAAVAGARAPFHRAPAATGALPSVPWPDCASARSTVRNRKSCTARGSRKRNSSFCGCAFTSTCVGSRRRYRFHAG